jgi:hypothetical protein
MYKVSIKDLNEITKFLDSINELDIGRNFCEIIKLKRVKEKAKKLSGKIKKNYTEIN